jgi:large subunit ribosomal protein L10e
MRLSFGRPIGTAARVNANQKLITVRVTKEFGALAKESLRRAMGKISVPSRLIVEKGENLF